MLKSLQVNNYLLIDRLIFEPEKGFTVLTGETGAGKSIIIDALGLILGNRLSNGFIVVDDKKSIIEAEFDISKIFEVKNILQKNDIDELDNLIIRREIQKNGKSRAFINDTPVTLILLEQISSLLVDLHNQFANQAINQNEFKLLVVDSIAGSLDMAREYKQEYDDFIKFKQEFNQKSKLLASISSEIEFIEFQLASIKNTGVNTNQEFTEIEQEAKFLSQAEDLKIAVHQVSNILSDDDNSVLNKFRECDNIMEKLAAKSDYIQKLSQRFSSAFIDLKDIADETETLLHQLDADPARLQVLNDKLDAINSLFHKFRINSFEELLEIEARFEEKIKTANTLDIETQEMAKTLKNKEKAILDKAEKLSEKRNSVLKKIGDNTVEMLKKLGIQNAQFYLINEKLDFPEDFGFDIIEFMFSANKNMPANKVSDTASGGELSRIMLCLKSFISSETSIPTLIFDEIDTGVSGEIADKMGAIMQDLAKDRQVISITHLPQVAARGQQHYKVIKDEKNDRSQTSLILLNEDSRIEELAGMLSGSQITDAARKQAKLLLHNSN